MTEFEYQVATINLIIIGVPILLWVIVVWIEVWRGRRR